MNITVTIILSILMLIFIIVLVREDVLISIGKFLNKFPPKLVKIILYIEIIISVIYIIVLEIIKFK